MVSSSSRSKIGLGAFLLAVAGLAAYWNSFHGAWLFDDDLSLPGNKTLRHLWTSFFPPTGGYTVSGRPLLNFSFALNYAVGKDSVFGYHLVNLLIHLLSGLILFGIVRRTLEQPALRQTFGRDAGLLAWMIALLWILHPLQTEAITYIVQRAESLAALFYLGALYAFMRSAEEGAWEGWRWLSVLSCFLGVGAKETVATAPLMILLYDRTYLAGSFRAAWRLRRSTYLGLFLSWVPLGLLVFFNHSRGGSAGWNAANQGVAFTLIQSCVILHYFYLAVWPARLVFDYGVQAMPLHRLVLQLGLLGLLLCGIALLYGRRPAWGFWLVWILLILAPSSSFVAIATQTAAEHRFYLPLAGFLVCAWMGIYCLTGRRILLCLVLGVGVAFLYGVKTFHRNRDYETPIRMWTDTVKKNPTNTRALLNLGAAFFNAHRYQESASTYALAIRPHLAAARMSYADALNMLNRPREAYGFYVQASQINHTEPELPFHFGMFLLQQGHLAEAEDQLRKSLRLDADNFRVQEALGVVYLLEGRAVEARALFAKVLQLEPEDQAFRKEMEQYLLRLDPQH